MALFRIHSHVPAPRAVADFRTEMERLFEDFLAPEARATIALPLDVAEDANNYYVHAELPGVDPGTVELSYQEGTLTLRGEKKSEAEVHGKSWHRVERHYGAFQRSLNLPGAVDPDRIAAEFDKGVLTVTLPKREETKPRTITIKPTGK